MSWLTRAANAVGIIGAKADTFTSISLTQGRQDQDNFVTNRITLSDCEDNFGHNAALGLSTTWSCVGLLAGLTGSLPANIYVPGPGGVSMVKADHPLHNLLHNSPNTEDTAMDFWEFVAASIELRGHAYARKLMSGNRVVSLIPLDPGLVNRKKVGGQWRYDWTINGKREEVGADQILHIRGPMGGLSPLEVCRRSFSSALAVENSARTTFANGIRPTGVLSTEKNLSPEQRQLAEQLLVQRYTGASNQGRPLLLDGGVKWEQLSISPDDAQMLETRQFSVEDICRIFGVPPHMVGHTSKSTSWGTGLEQQTLGFLTFVFRRRLKRIEQAVAKQILSAEDRAQGVTFGFNIDALLRGDSASRASFYQSGLQNGWRTINEVRALENLPPVPGGDIPRMQMQNQPIDAEPEETDEEEPDASDQE